MCTELQHLFYDYVKQDKSNFATKQEGNIRILTFNVHNWKDYLNRNSLKTILSVIINSNADIVGLCEAMFSNADTKSIIIKKFSNAGYKFIEMCNERYGINIVFSKHKILSKKIIHLGRDPIAQQNRYAIACTISTPAIINLVLAHLDVYDETEDTRFKQALKIIDNIDDTYIFMGDLNSLRQKDYSTKQWKLIEETDKDRQVCSQTKVTNLIELNNFTDSFTKLNVSCPPVTVWSMRRVDYIFIGNKFKYTINGSYIYKTLVSDHFPMYIDFKIEDKE
jgi:exonuclease III